MRTAENVKLCFNIIIPKDCRFKEFIKYKKWKLDTSSICRSFSSMGNSLFTTLKNYYVFTLVFVINSIQEYRHKGGKSLSIAEFILRIVSG